MSFWRHALLSTLFLFFGICSPILSVILPAGQSEYRFLYEALRRGEVMGGYREYNYNVAPYRLDGYAGDVRQPLLIFLSAEDKPGGLILFSEDYRSEKYSRAKAFESARFGVSAAPKENLFMYADFTLNEEMADDSEYRGKKWRGLAGEMETALIAYYWKKHTIIFGRFASFWGPTWESLILSGDAKPMDGISVRVHWGRLDFTYQFAVLERLQEFESRETTFENRYFSGHRLDFRIFDNLNLGLFETIVFGGPGRGLEFSYLNPIMSYHAAQVNADIDDNTLLGMDLCYYAGDRHKIYGQFLIDDFQIDDEDRGDNEPHETAFIMGVHSVDWWDFFDIKADYLRIANRTYNQFYERNRYANRGELIGNALGPDSERWSLALIKWFDDRKRASLNLEYTRKGEGRYDDEWTEPWHKIDDYRESFPTGVVEKSWLIYVRAAGFYRELVFFDINLGFESVKNYAHLADDDRTIPFVSFRASLILSSLTNIL